MLTEAEVLAALPPTGFVRSYVEYARECTDANIAYHLAGALACLTQAVPIDYAVPFATPLHGNLFSLLVGESSLSRKTAAIGIARRVIDNAIPGSVGETPGSQEGLYDSLRGQQKQLVIYGEFGEFLAKAEEGYMMPLKTAYTGLFDCSPTGRALVKNKKGNIENPRLSLLCAVATELLERHTEQADWTGGFLARFLTFYAEPEREFASMPIDNAQKRAGITKWLADLATVTTPPGQCLWLDDAGLAMWREWYEHLRAEKDSAGRRSVAACARATSLASKIALLLSWDSGPARSGQPWYVGPTELESAMKIANLHLKSVVELGQWIAGTRDMRDRATVLRAVATTPTPLGFILRQSEMLKRRANEVLDTLLEERAIVREVVQGETCFRRTPHLADSLAAMARAGRDDDGEAPANVAALRPPRPPAIPDPVPEADRYDDEDEWSKFDG